MKPRSALLVALMLVTPLAARAAPPPPEAMGPPCPDPEVARLRTEIGAIKLDRLLNLTRDQARGLLPTLKEAQQVAAQTRAEMQQRKPALVQALTAARDELKRSGQVSAATAQALREARGDAGMRDMRGRFKLLRDKVKGQLTVEQFERLRSFTPMPLDKGAKDGGPDLDEDDFGGPHGRAHGKRGPGKLGAGHGPMVLHVMLSPEFSALVEARAK